MNRGLLGKSIREVWPATLLFGLALAVFEALLVYILPNFFAESAAQVFQLPFVQTIMKGILGTEFSNSIGPGALMSIAWVHPVVLSVVWAHEITLCTRMPAGEIDRGTIDVLLSLPVSRTRVYVCETVVWLGAGLTMLGMGFAGNTVGGWLAGPEYRAVLGQRLAVVANLFCLYLAVGGATLLVSSLSDRRGRAVGVVFGIVLVSFLLNFLAQFWAPAKSVSFLSVMNYYRPLLVVRGSGWPITDMIVLATVGVVLWSIGAAVFARRDICTV